MDPITISVILGLVSLLGTGVGIASGLGEADAEKRQAQENQRLANLAAADAVQRGAIEEGQLKMAGTSLAGEQTVAFGTNGIDSSIGTASRVMQESAARVAMDAATIRANAAREAWGYQTQGLEFGRNAKMIETRGRNKAFATALGGVAQAGSYFAK